MSQHAIFHNPALATLTMDGGLKVDPTLLLHNIGKAVGEALVLASNDELDGEVRWDEVACRTVEVMPNEFDEPGYRCVIGGAAPDNDELQGHVASYVYCKMGVSLAVATEW